MCSLVSTGGKVTLKANDPPSTWRYSQRTALGLAPSFPSRDRGTERGDIETQRLQRVWLMQGLCLPFCSHLVVYALRTPLGARRAGSLVASILACFPELGSQGCNPCSWPAITACQTFLLFQNMIYMDTIFFLSFPPLGYYFSLKNTFKGYIFLCKHNSYFSTLSSPKESPKSLSSKSHDL
jgi:hypothetical protein